jgi:hypothetical protein
LTTAPEREVDVGGYLPRAGAHTLLRLANGAERDGAANPELQFVGQVLERWLGQCPQGSLELGPEAAQALSALLTGWSSMVIHALAAKPLSVDEVVEAIPILRPASTQDRVDEMIAAGQLEVFRGRRGVERFGATEWLRLAIAPLGAAARYELRHPAESAEPIVARDVEAAFLLTLPLLELPEEMSGVCSLAVDLAEGVPGGPAGATVRVEAGRVVCGEARLAEIVDVWTATSVGDWLDTVIEPDVKLVRSGGDRRMAQRLLDELHRTLFGASRSGNSQTETYT